MNFYNKTAEIFIPDNSSIEVALKRTTHLAIAAHQDDIEIMAYHGISQCFKQENLWFLGIILTNGEGSPKNGSYSQYTNEEFKEIRKLEQKKAAFIGEYSAVIFLDYTSKEIKDSNNKNILLDLQQILKMTNPQIIYTHNLADKHDTHIATSLRTISAIKETKKNIEHLYGCEVWRDLDWLCDNDKVVFDVSDRPNLASALVEVFDSQITGGKRYDLATNGRRLANATYSKSDSTDTSNLKSFAIDLTPIIKQNIDPLTYINQHLDRFKEDINSRILKLI